MGLEICFPNKCDKKATAADKSGNRASVRLTPGNKL